MYARALGNWADCNKHVWKWEHPQLVKLWLKDSGSHMSQNGCVLLGQTKLWLAFSKENLLDSIAEIKTAEMSAVEERFFSLPSPYELWKRCSLTNAVAVISNRMKTSFHQHLYGDRHISMSMKRHGKYTKYLVNCDGLQDHRIES